MREYCYIKPIKSTHTLELEPQALENAFPSAMLQIIPAFLILVVLLLDLSYAIVNATSWEPALLVDFGKWTNLLCAFLSFLATAISGVLVATKKYSSLLLGIVITLICGLSLTLFATWLSSWFINT